MNINSFFKSIIDQDTSPVVICDLEHTVVYMNPASIARYHTDLTGKSLKACHNANSNEKIDRVVAWFTESKENNIVFTSRNDKENKDVYMVALRDDNGTLIGYYEKHEYRNKETAELYAMNGFESSNYEAEVRERFGSTDAYKEYSEKTANYTKEKRQQATNGLNEIFVKFAECKKAGSSANSNEAKAVVEQLKAYITENYYTCTDQILGVLGQMYVEDARFKNNIDKNGEGTAEFTLSAIESYIKG